MTDFRRRVSLIITAWCIFRDVLWGLCYILFGVPFRIHDDLLQLFNTLGFASTVLLFGLVGLINFWWKQFWLSLAFLAFNAMFCVYLTWNLIAKLHDRAAVLSTADALLVFAALVLLLRSHEEHKLLREDL